MYRPRTLHGQARLLRAHLAVLGQRLARPLERALYWLFVKEW